MGYKAVIFDMDGVLIDSESFYLDRLYRGMVKRYPWIKREELFPTVGMSAAEDRILMYRLAKKQPVDSEFEKVLEAIHGESELSDFREVLFSEAPGVLRGLKEHGCQVALASSSPLRDIRRMLRQCGLEDCFDFVISGEQVHESKPNPEIYKKAMEALGRKPEECLIVEDSTYGIRAAAAAGADVAARLDDRFCFDRSQATYVINTLDDVWGLL